VPPCARRPRPSRRLRSALTGTAVALTAGALLGAALPDALPDARPAGLGDRLFPGLGNPGYDVGSYDISFDYSGHNTDPLDARTVIDARVTAPGGLSRFNLDFAGGSVRSVEVNGRTAAHARAKEDLVVAPAQRLAFGQHLHIVVRHTSTTGGGKTGGWVRTRDGLAMANQADAAHRVFPGNDHPSDKAQFTFRVRAPRGYTVVAGGLPAGRERTARHTVWTYRSDHPLATELAQVSIGRSAVLRRTGPHGLPVRDVVPRSEAAALRPWLKQTPAQIAWLERRLGRYPFGAYGLLIADATTGFELETQTLSLFERDLFRSGAGPAWYRKSLMVHELTHQWFGDSVTPERWDDLWLNESHATWYEWLYGQHSGGPSLERRARSAYWHSDTWRKRYGPPARLRPARHDDKIDIFRPIVYDGSAVVLYALRQKIGEEAFGRLERAWLARHRDGNASTADFVRLASAVYGRDLGGFLHAWLYGAKTPPMPGHPDWHSS